MKTLNHLAIIPDGNRRWAKKKGLPTFYGHKKGSERFIELSKKSRDLGIKVLSFWAFSTENWQRDSKEISYLMDLFEQLIDKNLKIALKEEIRIVHLGRKDRLKNELRERVIKVEEQTKKFNRYYLAIALDYGGHDEILRAVKKIIDQNISSTDLNADTFSNFLDTKDLPYPYPDLIIRTSGEIRTSGFMIWQSAYSEWIFSPKYFPDFTSIDLENCIKEYFKRERRFGC